MVISSLRLFHNKFGGLAAFAQIHKEGVDTGRYTVGNRKVERLFARRSAERAAIDFSARNVHQTNAQVLFRFSCEADRYVATRRVGVHRVGYRLRCVEACFSRRCAESEFLRKVAEDRTAYRTNFHTIVRTRLQACDRSEVLGSVGDLVLRVGKFAVIDFVARGIRNGCPEEVSRRLRDVIHSQARRDTATDTLRCKEEGRSRESTYIHRTALGTHLNFIFTVGH